MMNAGRRVWALGTGHWALGTGHGELDSMLNIEASAMDMS